MNGSLSKIDQQLKTAVLQYATLAQAIAHQAQPDPSLERDYQTALGTLIRLQAVQDMLLFEQEAADYNQLVEENRQNADALRNALDRLDIFEAREQANRLDQSRRRAEERFEAAAACLDDYARSIYQQAYHASVTHFADERKAEIAGLITACRTIEAYTKSLARPVDSDQVIKQWVVAKGAIDKAMRLFVASQLSYRAR